MLVISICSGVDSRKIGATAEAVACWLLLSILGSSPNGAGTGGVVGIP